MPFPDPSRRHPVTLADGQPHTGTVFLAPAITHPRWEIGAYTYASAHIPPRDWAARLAPYLYPFSAEKLVLGRFCQIADSVTFVTASANHRLDGFSTFPFAIFEGLDMTRPSIPKGPFPDTVIGHDVWFGQGARILPGARIGSGSIIGTGAVVGGTIPPYSVVAGNPGKVVRQRFDAATIDRLLDIAWWDWSIDRILAHEGAICGGNIAQLEAAARAG